MESTPVNMGIHKDLMNTTFVCKFRWMVESDLRIPTYFLKSFNIDWTKKEIELTAHETCGENDDDVPILRWIDAIQASPDKLFLETFDGCGNSIYGVIFEGATLLDQKSGFDYAVSELSEQRVRLKYQNTTRYRRKRSDLLQKPDLQVVV